VGFGQVIQFGLFLSVLGKIELLEVFILEESDCFRPGTVSRGSPIRFLPGAPTLQYSPSLQLHGRFAGGLVPETGILCPVPWLFPIPSLEIFLKPADSTVHFSLCYAEKISKGRNQMLTVREHVLQDTKILELSGRFDYQSKLGIEVAILGAQEIGCRHIVLNFSNITWIDSVGLGQMFLWYHRLKPERIRLSIVSPQATVRELLEFANLPQVVPVYQSEEEAVAARGRWPHSPPS
jgi:anti-anti-sigma factor